MIDSLRLMKLHGVRAIATTTPRSWNVMLYIRDVHNEVVNIDLEFTSRAAKRKFSEELLEGIQAVIEQMDVEDRQALERFQQYSHVKPE